MHKSQKPQRYSRFITVFETIHDNVCAFNIMDLIFRPISCV